MKVYEIIRLPFLRFNIKRREMKTMTPDELHGISKYIEHFIRAPGVYEKEHMLLGVDEYFAVVNDRYMTIEMVEWSTIRLTIQRVIGLLGIPIFCRGLLIVFDRRDEFVPGTTLTIGDCYYRITDNIIKNQNVRQYNTDDENLKEQDMNVIKDVLGG